jgi:serine/threonine protein kinase
MSPLIEGFCNEMIRARLLPPEQVEDLARRWQAEAGSAASDLDHFTRWLVAGGVLTDYQVGVLERGNADQLLIGPYKILERIGRGRMAGVYRAVHELGATVAIKVLPPSRARDPQSLGRFQRESRLALRLCHPNIVRTFQTGEVNGLHYLVMELLEGETLEEVLHRRRVLPPAEAARLVHQALQGLAEVHKEGLVHRDLKPANLMLVGGKPETTLDATVKILDIGLGRALFDEGAGDPNFQLTNEGDILGTPEYMAPEQIRDPSGVDIRADIYSLGCVFYQTLAGTPPFVEANPVRLLLRVATEEPRPIRSLTPAVPEGLQQILSWMLVKDPAQRYPSPDRAAGALQVFLAAGAEPAAPEKDVRMRPYLMWLSAQNSEVPVAVPVNAPGIVHPSAPGRVAPPVRPPDPVPATAPARAPRTGVLREDIPVVKVFPVKAGPKAPATAEPEETRPRKKRPTPEPEEPSRPRKAKPERSRRDREKDEEEQPRKQTRRTAAEDESEEPAGLTSRDILFVLAGVGGLAALGVLTFLGWLVFRQVRRKPPEPEPIPEPENPGDEKR